MFSLPNRIWMGKGHTVEYIRVDWLVGWIEAEIQVHEFWDFDTNSLEDVLRLIKDTSPQTPPPSHEED